MKLNARVSSRCLLQETCDSSFGKTLFSRSTYSTNWMAPSADNLQSDRSFAGSWSWGRACVRPLAEDKYAAVLRRCSAGGWFPQRHFSQVMSLSLHCSLFSAGIRTRSVQTRPLLIPTLSWFVAVETSRWLINPRFKSWPGKQTPNSLVRPLEGCGLFLKIFIKLPLYQWLWDEDLCASLQTGRDLKSATRPAVSFTWLSRPFLLRHDRIRGTCLSVYFPQMAAGLNVLVEQGVGERRDKESGDTKASS